MARQCPKCGLLLPDDAPDQVCPVCSFQNALEPVASTLNAEAGGTDFPPSLTRSLLGINRFDDYELLELLAQGGMGVVYKARQISLNRTVALKMIQAGVLATSAEVKRFHSEAEAIAHLHHRNIVAVHEIGEHNGQQFFSMDYVAGRTLAEVVRDGPLPAARAATYVKTIAEAVHYAHQQGIIHRDLKPANVIIDENDEPHITDFGLAKRLTDSQLSTLNTQLTLSGQVLGSPNYLPPEQAEPKPGAVGAPSDVYAIGAILYHLVTGRPPFQAESLTTLLRQVIEIDPLAPRSLNPGIPRDLETICLKCLEKDVSRRYFTAQGLADELGRFLAGEPIRARPVGAFGKTWKWCRRQPFRASLIGALALVVAFGTAGISWQWQRAERERDVALRHAYAGDMKLAQLSLEEGDLGGAKRLLDKYRPTSAKASTLDHHASIDLRGWEWRYLWGLCRGEDQARITQTNRSYANLALSPDGEVTALRLPDGDIELWNWRAHQFLGTLTNNGWPLAMAFSPDGKFIASGNNNRAGQPVVSFWDVAARRIVHDWPQASPVTSLAFSPNGALLAMFHTSPEVSLLEASSGRIVTNYTAGSLVNDQMRIPLFSPDSTRLILTDALIRIIDLETGNTCEMQATLPGNYVSALAISPDGQILASGAGYSDAAIRLWDARACKQAGSLEGHRSWVKQLVFSPDGQTLYSASADQTIRAWNVKEQRELRRWRGHTGALTGLALTPDARTLISCASDDSVRIWELEAPNRPPASIALPVLVGPYGAPFTSDSRRLITVSASDPVIVWDVASGQEVERIPLLGTNLQSIALSPDERWLATGSLDGVIQVWDMQKRALVSRFQASSKSNAIYGVVFLAPDSSLLSVAVRLHEDHELKRWEAGSWREISTGLPGVQLCRGWAQSPDGRLFAVADELGPTRLWHIPSGQLRAEFGTSGFVPAFSPNGRLLATGEGRARVWDIRLRREVACLEQQANNLVAVAFSPDGRRLVTGSMTGGNVQPAIEVWDYAVQRGLLSLRSRGAFTTWMQFSPDGNTLLTHSWYGVAELWHAPSWAEIEAESDARTK